MMNRLLDRLEARVGKHRGVRNLMTIISIGIAIVYAADYVLPGVLSGASLSDYLRFDKAAIMSGQIWRVITFVFVPMDTSLLWLIISLYFYWQMGEQLQNEWGTFRFTLFYTVGVLGTVLAGCLTGYATSYYLNMSVLLAMAIVRPNMPMRFYGVIELRLKWFALISLVMMLLPVLRGGAWREAAAIAVALLNVLLFFLDYMIGLGRDAWRRYQWKRNWRSGWRR